MKNPEQQSAESDLVQRMAAAIRSNPAISHEQSQELRQSPDSKTAQPSQVDIDRTPESSQLYRMKHSAEESGSLQQLQITDQNLVKQPTEKSKVMSEVDGANPFQTKYKKALSEVSRLMKTNKQLKIELDSTKLRNIGGPEQAALIRENDQLKFTIQRLETTVKELESTNRLYTDQLNDYEAVLRNNRAKSEQKIADLTSAVRAKQTELRELRQMKAALQTEAMRPNEVIFELKVTIERYKKQQTVWQTERRNFFDQILQLQKELEQGKVEKEKLVQHMDAELKEQGLNLRRQLQKQIFEYKAENSNLKQSLEILTKQNERLTREIKLSYDATLDKHRDEAKLVWELTCQLEGLRQEGSKLRQALLIQEQAEAQSQIIRNQLIQANHNAEMMNSQNHQLRIQISELQQQLEHFKSKAHRGDSHIVDPIISTPSGKGLDYTRQKELFQSELRAARLQAQQLKGQNHMLCAEIEQLHSKLQKQTVMGQSGKTEVLMTSNALALQGKLKEFRLRIDLLPNLKSKENDVQRELALLRALLSEVQASIRAVVTDNQGFLQKARRYKDKIHVINSKYEISHRQNKKLMVKVAGYEKLVEKYEKQLEKQYQLSKIKGKVNVQQVEDPAHNLTKVRDLEQRIVLQEKHFQQQLRTRQLDFDTKILAKKLEIDQLKEQLGSFELYKNKIRELSDKVIELEALNNQYWMKLSYTDRSQQPAPAPQQNNEIVALIEKLTEREDKIIQLEFNVARLNQSNEVLQMQLKELQLMHDSLIEQANATKSRLAEAHLIIERLNQDLSTYESRLNELSKYRGFETTIAHHTEQQSAKQRQITELRILAKKLSEANAMLEYQLNVAKNSVSLKTNEVSQLKQENGQLKNNIDELNYQVERQRKELLSVTATISSEKTAAESAELHNKRTIQELKSRTAAAEAEINRLRDIESQLQAEKSQNSGVKSQFATFTDRILQLQAQLQHYTTQQAKQQNLHTKRYEKELQNELELSSLRLEKDRLDKLRTHLLSQIEDLQQLITKERRAHSQEITKLYADALQQRSRTTATDLSPKKDYASQQSKDQNTKLQEQIKSLRSEIAQMTEKSNEMKQYIHELQIQSEQFKSKTDSYVRQIERLREFLKDKQDKMNQKIDKLIDAEKISKEMEYQIYNLKVDLQKLQQLKQGNGELYTQLQRLRKLNTQLQVDLGQLRLKYSNDNTYEQRLKENLGLFVLLFAEIESLRSQLKKRQLEMNESRRSSLAITTAPLLGQASPKRLESSTFTKDRISSPIIAIQVPDYDELVGQSRYGGASPDITKLSYQTDSATSIFPR